jgi:repressor LexA
LTRRQREVLVVIRDYQRRYGYSPSVREIGSKLGLSSPSTPFAHLDGLERLGLVDRGPADTNRTLTITAAGWSALNAEEMS